MLALRALTTRWKTSHDDRNGVAFGLIAATGVDILIDGVVVGSGFASAQQTGLLLVIALVLEFFFLGLSVATTMGAVARWQIILMPTGLATLVLVGAAVGTITLQNAAAPIVATVLAFGAVALMYLVTEELLTEAHEVAETLWGTSLFFVGFLAFLIITELIG